MNLSPIISYLDAYICDPTMRTAGRTDERLNAMTEANISKLFQEAFLDGYFYLTEDFYVMSYNGKRYEKLDKDYIKLVVKTTMAQIGIGIVYCENSPEKIAKSVLLSLLKKEFFQHDKRYITFNNCVLEVSTGKQLAHDPKYMSRVVMDFDYLPNMRFPRWEQFLDEVLPNLEIRLNLQEFCGALLLDRRSYKFEFAAYCTGNGNNGKSVFWGAVQNMLGDANSSSFSPTQLFVSSDKQYNRATADGKIVNVCDDASKENFSGGDYKAYVSNGEMMARDPYGKPFKVRNAPLLVMCLNEMPITTDDSFGHERRQFIFPFECTIAPDKVDIMLPSTLNCVESMQAIFNWIYEGAQRMIANKGKFTVNESMAKAKLDAKLDSNSALRWIRDNGYTVVSKDEATPSDWQSVAMLHQSYVEACNKAKVPPIALDRFSKILSNNGFVKFRKGVGMGFYIKQVPMTDEMLEEIASDNCPF